MAEPDTDELVKRLRDEANRLRLCTHEIEAKAAAQAAVAAATIERLRAALRPFAELIDRRWEDRDRSVADVRKHGLVVMELQMVSLNHVLAAIDALTPTREER